MQWDRLLYGIFRAFEVVSLQASTPNREQLPVSSSARSRTAGEFVERCHDTLFTTSEAKLAKTDEVRVLR
jgi:hypothetical protein